MGEKEKCTECNDKSATKDRNGKEDGYCDSCRFKKALDGIGKPNE